MHGKKIMSVVAASCVAISALCGCGGVSQDEFDTKVSELQAEVSSLKDDVSAKEQEISKLNDNITSLESENSKLNIQNEEQLEKIDELENGASKLLSDVNNAYESKDYSKAVQIASELHKKFNGSEEDVKAQEIAEKSQAELDRIEAEKKAEEERKAAEAAKSAQDKAREHIRIGGVNIEEINSADGVSVGVYWRNESQKDMKYLTFTLVPYNGVGDQVYSTIGSKSEARCKVTGSLPPSATLINERLDENYFYYLSPKNTWEYVATFGTGDHHYSYYNFTNTWKLVEVKLSDADMANAFQQAYFDCIWYNNTVKEAKLTKIEIEYMDGTKVTLTGDEIGYVTY